MNLNMLKLLIQYSRLLQQKCWIKLHFPIRKDGQKYTVYILLECQSIARGELS